MTKTLRRIKKIVQGKPAIDGAGVHLVRLFGRDETQDFDPFLLMDAFDSTEPEDYIRGFPWHPHRGIETVTYLIKGDLEHGDSLGNRGSILDGDCQWMTAGSGIIHQEMPQPTEHLLGCQLWLNLPARDKMTAPAYNDILSADVPLIDEGIARVRIIAGTYNGQQGAFEGAFVRPLYLDVDVEPRQTWTLETTAGTTLFIYIISGTATFEPEVDEEISYKNVVLFDEGEQFWMRAGDTGARILLLNAPRLDEPIAWGGPIVMNTRQELNQAFSELRENTFIK
ncbi:MAG: pirin family protein [Chloroflexi bacterium]|nr:pirin family protein [Chloroflexota bacterium]